MNIEIKNDDNHGYEAHAEIELETADTPNPQAPAEPGDTIVPFSPKESATIQPLTPRQKSVARRLIAGASVGAFVIFGTLGCQSVGNYTQLPKPPAMRYAASMGGNDYTSASSSSPANEVPRDEAR